ncbi:MAG: ribosome maturation factor RimP [Clostridia bacterium]|nr:ribosome maturation factor RimP [Clostridia bacterium]
MSYSKLEMSILELAESIAAENGCYIYDLEYIKEGKSKVLRVYADKEETGINLDECEVINRRLGDLLDERALISENYVLEVSSPGIERRLRTKEHFDRYTGRQIDVGLYKALDGSKTLSGILKGFKDETIFIETEIGELSIMQGEVSSVKLHFDF